MVAVDLDHGVYDLPVVDTPGSPGHSAGCLMTTQDPVHVPHAHSEASMKRVVVVMLLAVVLGMGLSGCFPGGGTYSPQERAGFFSGVWHGWIAPVSLIVGLFKDDVRIYEPFNTGWWYDFGFYIAVIAGFGGIALSRKTRKRSANA
jgi:hypothetical protein